MIVLYAAEQNLNSTFLQPAEVRRRHRLQNRLQRYECLRHLRIVCRPSRLEYDPFQPTELWLKQDASHLFPIEGIENLRRVGRIAPQYRIHGEANFLQNGRGELREDGGEP